MLKEIVSKKYLIIPRYWKNHTGVVIYIYAIVHRPHRDVTYQLMKKVWSGVASVTYNAGTRMFAAHALQEGEPSVI